jgi:hypothetical protein
VRFVVGKVAQGQAFSKYLVFPASHSTDYSTLIIRSKGGREGESLRIRYDVIFAVM